jgi:hypothetical protein
MLADSLTKPEDWPLQQPPLGDPWTESYPKSSRLELSYSPPGSLSSGTFSVSRVGPRVPVVAIWQIVSTSYRFWSSCRVGPETCVKPVRLEEREHCNIFVTICYTQLMCQETRVQEDHAYQYPVMLWRG